MKINKKREITKILEDNNFVKLEKEENLKNLNMKKL